MVGFGGAIKDWHALTPAIPCDVKDASYDESLNRNLKSLFNKRSEL